MKRNNFLWIKNYMIILKKICLRYKHPNQYKVDLHLRLIIGIKFFKKSKFTTAYTNMKVGALHEQGKFL